MKKFVSAWIFLVLAVVLVCGGRLLAKMVQKAPEADDNVIVITGDIPRIAGLYASEDVLWMIPVQLGTDYEYQYDVCRIDESGEPQFVAQFPGNNLVWNEGDARFYYLSDETTLCSCDPSTGTISSHPLTQSYSRVCAAEDAYVFLQQEQSGVVTMLSPGQTGETALNIDGWILGTYNGRLLSWNNFDYALSCYDYISDRLVWDADLSAYFSSAPVLCESNDFLYLSGGTLPEVYAVPQFTEQFEWQKFPIKRSGFVLAMAAAEDYIVCVSVAVTRDSLSFFALYPNGDIVDITKRQGPSYYRSGSILTEVFDRRLYWAVNTEQELFSYDLPF